MVLVVELNPRFKSLNSNSFRHTMNFRTRERRAIVDITISGFEFYVTGGMPLDLSVIRDFTQVYSSVMLTQPVIPSPNHEIRIIPGADASLAKLAVISIETGNELGNGFPLFDFDVNISMEIIGI